MSYLQFVTGDTESTSESQRDKVHSTKVRKAKYQYIVIPTFKTDIPPILVGLGEGKEIFKPLTDIRTPELCYVHNGVRGVYSRA